MKNIFITGATGFLGSYLLKRALDEKGVTPVVLARGKKGESAEDRVASALKYFYGAGYKDVLSKVKIIEGEVDKESLGVSKKDKDFLIKEIDEIYHSAAIAEFRVPLDKIRRSNVQGAVNVFDFALQCKEEGRLKKVNHISTTFTGGTKTGVFYESELNVGQGFHNTYEQSKLEAEGAVNDYRKKGLDITIFRPSILTGSYSDGRTSNFKMLYQPLHFFANELFEAVPGNRETKCNLIPVDTTADAIFIIAGGESDRNRTFHIANPVTVSVGHFFDIAADFFGFRRPEFVPIEKFDMERLTPVQKNLIGPYAPYFNYKLLFDVKESTALLEKKQFHVPAVDDEFLLKLFRYCKDTGFIKPKKRDYVTAG